MALASRIRPLKRLTRPLVCGDFVRLRQCSLSSVVCSRRPCANRPPRPQRRFQRRRVFSETPNSCASGRIGLFERWIAARRSGRASGFRRPASRPGAQTATSAAGVDSGTGRYSEAIGESGQSPIAGADTDGGGGRLPKAVYTDHTRSPRTQIVVLGGLKVPVTLLESTQQGFTDEH